MLIVLIATAWGSGEGGINAFNYSLAIGLAQIGAKELQVYCAVPNPQEAQVRDAANFGIQLISVAAGADNQPTDVCGHEVTSWLHERGIGRPDLWIGHDIITGFAALAASEICGRVALIHHMAYLEYYNAAGGRGASTILKHGEQRQLFSSKGAIVFGVGTALTANALTLSSSSACALIPGFPTSFVKNVSDSRSLRVIVAGRFDAASEALKQSRLAAAGLAQAVQEAGKLLHCLSSPTMVVFGVAEDRATAGELEDLAREFAGRRINIVPGPFDAAPGVLASEMASCNLAIMPSFHEGFGLVGWEAIGCEVPLIVGRETGLFKLVDGLLGGRGTGCLGAIEIRGGDLHAPDVDAMAKAIIDVARDLNRARTDAAMLRVQLAAEKGCTWRHTALSLLKEVLGAGVSVPLAVVDPETASLPRSLSSRSRTQFRSSAKNYFAECAELSLSDGQGSTPNHFDVLAELRFGTTSLKIDDMLVDVFVKRAAVRVNTDGGSLRGERLGEGRHPIPGIQTMAGGVWIVSDPNGGEALRGKLLGDEVLCRVETPSGVSAGARIEVTASPPDFGCNIMLPGECDVALATRKVMELFLKKAIFQERSGHVLLSEAVLKEAGTSA